MPTLKKRINITLKDDLAEMLAQLAKLDKVPKATKAAELLEEALELEEDRILDAIANEREAKGGKLIHFEKVWKQNTR